MVAGTKFHMLLPIFVYERHSNTLTITENFLKQPNQNMCLTEDNRNMKSKINRKRHFKI